MPAERRLSEFLAEGRGMWIEAQAEVVALIDDRPGEAGIARFEQGLQPEGDTDLDVGIVPFERLVELGIEAFEGVPTTRIARHDLADLDTDIEEAGLEGHDRASRVVDIGLDDGRIVHRGMPEGLGHPTATRGQALAVLGQGRESDIDDMVGRNTARVVTPLVADTRRKRGVVERRLPGDAIVVVQGKEIRIRHDDLARLEVGLGCRIVGKGREAEVIAGSRRGLRRPGQGHDKEANGHDQGDAPSGWQVVGHGFVLVAKHRRAVLSPARGRGISQEYYHGSRRPPAPIARVDFQ